MKTLLGLVCAMYVLSTAAAAFADVIPPEVLACNTLDAGAACPGANVDPYVAAATAPGNCQSATCSRLDYSQGTPPIGTIQYPCLKCAAAGGGGRLSTTEPRAGSAGMTLGVTVAGAASVAAGGQQDAGSDPASLGGAPLTEAGGALGNSVGGTTDLESAGGRQDVGGSGESSSKSCTCTIAGYATPPSYGWALLLGLLALRRKRVRGQVHASSRANATT